MEKCLEKKKHSFHVYVEPLTKPINRIEQYDKDTIDIVAENIISISKHSNQNNKK